MRVGVSSSQSESILGGDATTRGHSGDVNVGYDRILGHQRDVVYKSSMDWVGRHSNSKLALNGTEINRTHDHQLRFKLSADNEKLSAEPMRMELGVVLGNYTHLTDPQVQEGNYVRLDFNARKQWFLTADESWQGSAKIRGQWSSRNLDGQNRFNLGGVNGVRAYTSVDGVGDDAVLLSLDLNKRLPGNVTVGAFYDAGLVRPAKTLTAGVFDRNYSLQAVGAQVGGNVGRWYYSTTLAKGVGGYKAWQASNIESKPNNWRLYAALTYLY
jgi:hypothetical protein